MSESLQAGQFFGQTNQSAYLEGLTLTDTEYTHEKVNWHYHENAYFTLILEGSVIEGNKKETYHCSAGTLLFHNWQEEHYNIKPKGFTRGFHIEIDQNWVKALELDLGISQGSINVSDPGIKIQAYHIFKEFKLNDSTSHLAVQSLLIGLLSQMNKTQTIAHAKIPAWVGRTTELLHDLSSEDWTLVSLAHAIGIHPVHLSRDFPRYFNSNLGVYIRGIRMQRALSLLPKKSLSLTDIAFECGFSDQSHFTRCFKAVNSIKPSEYRNILLK